MIETKYQNTILLGILFYILPQIKPMVESISNTMTQNYIWYSYHYSISILHLHYTYQQGTKLSNSLPKASNFIYMLHNFSHHTLHMQHDKVSMIYPTYIRQLHTTQHNFHYLSNREPYKLSIHSHLDIENMIGGKQPAHQEDINHTINGNARHKLSMKVVMSTKHKTEGIASSNLTSMHNILMGIILGMMNQRGNITQNISDKNTLKCKHHN
jgi:hypothetical protein